MVRKIILWLFVILWMWVIFSFSAQPATESDEISEGFTKKIVRVIDFADQLSEKEIDLIADNLNHIVRKSAHFCAYALLSLLVALLLKEYNFVRHHAMILAVVISGLYACTDEFHQTFVPGRSGEIRDVGIDTLGAIFGVLTLYFVSFVVKRIKERKNLLE